MPRKTKHDDEVRAVLNSTASSDSTARIHAERMAADPKYAEHIRQWQAAEKPILDDLAKIGYKVPSLQRLKDHREACQWAVPVLLHWLPLIGIPDMKQVMIYILAAHSPGKEFTKYLIEEFRKSDSSGPYAWAVGDALSGLDVKGFEGEIIGLCRNTKYGTARQLMVMNLNRLRDPRTEEVALDLLEDEDVKLHAITALSRMKSRRALFPLEKLLADGRPIIRKEARKAITKIMRQKQLKAERE